MIQSLVGTVVDATSTSDPRRPQILQMPAGETGRINVAVIHSSGAAWDLTGHQVLLTVFRDGVAVISKQVIITNTLGGLGYIPIDPGDTIKLVGRYTYDIVLTDTRTTPNPRYQVVPLSTFSVSGVLGQPGQPVTVGTSYPGLGSGPAGLSWRGIWNSLSAYAVNDAVQFLDVNGGLPALYSSFVCLVANTNTSPLDLTGALSADWTYLSQRGANGAGDGGAYTPANAAQWSPVPTTQQNAINQIATMLSRYILDGTAIPNAGGFLWANPQPATTSQQLDRLAAVVYADVLDGVPIGAGGSFSWASPTPILIADQIARLAYVIYLDVLNGVSIP